MKIFSRDQLAQIDRLTISYEPITEIDLMERASSALTGWLIDQYSPDNRMAIFAGPGNNGGDALAVARMLSGHGFAIHIFLPALASKRSEASRINLGRLDQYPEILMTELKDSRDFSDLKEYDVILDGLYGSGLSRPLEGFAAEIIEWINNSKVEVVSIDIPSGLMCDENLNNDGSIIRASYTLTLESPKLSLFFRENENYFGKWEIVKFGLSEKAIDEAETNIFFLEQQDVSPIIKKRKIFSHKGSYGHGLLIAGSSGKYGAALLAARGALRAGLGLLTVHLPETAGAVLQIGLPESMSRTDSGKDYITELPELTKYTAIAAGPGLGIQIVTQEVIRQLIEKSTIPLILDADALNILALNPGWLKKLPRETILTPHPTEFDRLSGIVTITEEERFMIAGQFAFSYGVILVLKGAFTRIFLPDGRIYFNSTGNPGMATAGSGDVLTGILLGLLCQGYIPAEAARLGVFLHGRSADIRVTYSSEESLIASEIADYLGDAFASLK